MSASNKTTKSKGEVEILSPEVARVVKNLGQKEKQVILQALSVTHHHRSGPLPPSDEIKVYAEVIPNGGDRLMATVETQLTHRVKLEEYGIKRTFNQSSTGQWIAFAIAILFGLIAWDLAKSGKETTACILGGADLVALFESLNNHFFTTEWVRVFLFPRSRVKTWHHYSVVEDCLASEGFFKTKNHELTCNQYH